MYLATDSSKSAQEIYTKGSKKLLLCDVFLGNSSKDQMNETSFVMTNKFHDHRTMENRSYKSTNVIQYMLQEIVKLKMKSSLSLTLIKFSQSI